MRQALRTRVKSGPVASIMLSLVVAAVFTVIQSGDLFVGSLAPTLGQETKSVLRVPFDVPEPGTLGGFVLRRENARTLVPAGTLLDADNLQHELVVAYEARRRPPQAASVIGIFVIFFTLSLSLTSYLRNFGQNRVKLLRAQIGMFVLITFLLLLAKLLLLATPLSDLWIPMAAVPLWVATSFDRRTAVVITFFCALAVTSLMSFELLLLWTMLTQGLAAILLLRDKRRSRNMILAGLLGGLCAAALFTSLVITTNGSFDVWGDLARVGQSQILACVGGGALAGLIGAVLRPLAERSLGSVSRERLLDLTDLEQPLLKKMAAEAPGSWEHARAMANLAEAAAAAIGGDALLTRVGAYYHDLGKTYHSKYFVENLAPGEPSPHDEMEPEVSADAIMHHVIYGTRILREGGIPEPVVEFAYTHHGTQCVEYFWNKCREQGNPRNFTADDFRYPGMKPQTKETAILMLVDSIEAASRTIDPPDRHQFEGMIQRIIFTKLQSGQLDESGLRPEDLRILVTRMGDTLVNMNHHRIKYPWQAKQAEEFGVPSQVTRPSAPDIQIHNTESSVPPALLDSQRPPSDKAPAESDNGVPKSDESGPRPAGTFRTGDEPAPGEPVRTTGGTRD